MPQSLTAFIDPGKPWQKGTNETFQRFLPRRCLRDGAVPIDGGAKAVIETWHSRGNDIRAHSSLRALTPSELERPQRNPSGPNITTRRPWNQSTTLIRSTNVHGCRKKKVYDICAASKRSALCIGGICFVNGLAAARRARR
ncbi:MAG: transposase [Myxococcales bacterium]|nr:transposase [Myxococcales bacterium]